MNLTGVLCWYLHWALLHWFSKKVRIIATCHLCCFTYLFLVPHRGFLYWPFYSQYSLLIPLKTSENLGFLMFSGGTKGKIGKKKVKSNGSKCFPNHFEMFQKYIDSPISRLCFHFMPLKTIENKRFSGVWRAYKMGTLAKNGLISLENLCW